MDAAGRPAEYGGNFRVNVSLCSRVFFEENPELKAGPGLSRGFP